MKNALYKKLFRLHVLKRIYFERLSEPLIYNLVSIWVLFFGSIRQKIAYDLVPRESYAFGLNEAFKRAKELDIDKIVVIEFGVAEGSGLFNLSTICASLTKEYDLDYEVFGFDTGAGLPEPIDYRDHPEKYRGGDYPPGKLDKEKLPEKTTLIYGPIRDTVGAFIDSLKAKEVIAFVSIDVDYYSSTMDCFELFGAGQEKFLPSTILYFDDINDLDHNEHMGELLAINEFNQKHSNRKICKMRYLANWRVFKNAVWLDRMYFLHIFDAKYRDPANWKNQPVIVLPNPYI